MQQINEIDTLDKLENFGLAIEEETLVLVDIDDTVITPEAGMFRYDSGHHRFIDDLKKNAANIPDFHKILANWRLQRRTMLVENTWPHFIKRWRGQGANVHGFTQINTGRFDLIPSMEEWRLHELINKGISFATSIFGHEHLLLAKEEKGYACFSKGILFTGPFSKRQLLEAFLVKTSLKPKRIVLLDDRADHVKAIRDLAKEQAIEYSGFIYKGCELLKGKFNLQVIKYQQKILLEKVRWIEDEKAAKELGISFQA